MDSQIINAILRKEKELGHSLTKEELLEHIHNIEQIRVNHHKIVEKDHAHDPHHHGMEIVNFAKSIAKDFKCSDEEIAVITCAAKFHDIGKIKISEKILNKPSALTEEEYEEIKQHVIYGHELLSTLPYIANLVRHHHERYDGKGYPDGLTGKNIPLGSRIISVIDSYNAMTHKRSYNKKKTMQEAVEELKKHAGTQFDPAVVKSFIDVLNKGFNPSLNSVKC